MEIRLTCSYPHSPQSNGLGERINKTLLRKSKELLMESGLNSRYRREAVMYDADLYNRIGIDGPGVTTPHESLLKHQPNNSRIRIFRCTRYVHRNNAVRSSNFDNHVELGIYLGTREGLISVIFVASKMRYRDQERLLRHKEFSAVDRCTKGDD